MSTIYIYLDDIRFPDDPMWAIARTAWQAYALVHAAYKKDSNAQIVLSLDHDLGENVSTGYDFLNWIEKDIVQLGKGFRPNLEIRVHSANPVGAANMGRAIASIQRLLENNVADNIEATIVDRIRRHGKLEGIKTYRALKGATLKIAKLAVEEIMRENGIG